MWSLPFRLVRYIHVPCTKMEVTRTKSKKSCLKYIHVSFLLGLSVSGRVKGKILVFQWIGSIHCVVPRPLFHVFNFVYFQYCLLVLSSYVICLLRKNNKVGEKKLKEEKRDEPKA